MAPRSDISQLRYTAGESMKKPPPVASEGDSSISTNHRSPPPFRKWVAEAMIRRFATRWSRHSGIFVFRQTHRSIALSGEDFAVIVYPNVIVAAVDLDIPVVRNLPVRRSRTQIRPRTST